ncbi:SDR family NAD(P)-dependent oxidoreductase [Kitasatospora sp. NPDC059673]|uniref:SDR family NAD(P)-dependent oxidoreductase n=1 Tax=Kitasatospora sp. NPDC059673 TaxID=3346901 RepID=UPI003686D49D
MAAVARVELEGKTALVTGGSRGLGLLVAEELVRRGCQVAVCARDGQQLLVAEQRLARLTTRYAAVECDLTAPGAPDELVERVTARLGPVDVLVNNAGVIQVGPLAAMDAADFRRAWDTMVRAPLELILAVLPGMRDRGAGSLVTIASIGGPVPAPHLLPYNTAKAALAALSRGLRVELSGSGIQVTTVTPGLMRTGSHLAAQFSGRARHEYSWFATASGAPLLSMDAGRAARRIVRATESGRAELTLTPAAKLATRIQALAPATAGRALAFTARLLPGPGPDPDHNCPGQDAARRTGRLVPALTALADRAARHTNEPGAQGS